jgi:ABC-type phosphate transport system auxiliary subunit
MAVTSNDFLQLVKQTLPQACSEIDYRNIISRSYYGMYHGTLEMLTTQPVPIKGAGCHKSLSEYLASYDAKTCEPYDIKELRRLKTFLEINKTKRVKADYELDAEIIQNDAVASCDVLEKYLQICTDMKETATKSNSSSI